MSVVAREEKVRGPAPRGVLGAGAVPAVAALTVLAAVLRFGRIGHQGFWFDEAHTALLLHFSPGTMLGLLPSSESTPPLYYCVAWVWARVFGFGETGLRSLSAVAGVLMVPVAYAAAAKLVSRRAGVIAAALVTTSPFLIWYSQEARAYELVALLSAVTLLTFAYARETPTPRSLAAWAIACALALATHYFAALAVVPEAAWLLATHRRRRPVQAAVGVVALVGLALVPLALSQRGTGNSNWIAHMPLGIRLSQVTPQFLLGFGAPAGRWLRALDAVVVLGALALLVRRAGAGERRGATVAGVLAVSGAVLMLALVAAGADELITRNVIILWLPLALVVAAGLGSARARWLGAAGVAVLCATGVAAAVDVSFNRDLERPDWRPVARALGPAPTTVGRAILIQHYGSLLPLSLYEPHLRFLRRGSALVDELDVIAIRSAPGKDCWWGSACNLIPSQVRASYPVPGFHTVSEEHILQFTLVRLRSDKPVRLTREIVVRALAARIPRHNGLIYQPPAAGR